MLVTTTARPRGMVQNTAVRYFNGRRYHVITTHVTFPLDNHTIQQMFTESVFIRHTTPVNFRSRMMTIPT